MTEGRRYSIRGRVQGVYFRAATREQALALGLVGQARNCPDGRVEAQAWGEASALDALGRWLWQGPPMARVEEVREAPAEGPAPEGFRIA
ncbi:acylphosphatase [Alkalilimnicola sp. S0819]|uniref:acylphosphatase n=1 Tax=Alkalilimnicola sp. S0819 TaxID=2613922 RepID=UPI001261C8EF|nr:acylphosphatase [Alkalilimnicola sp. S0819]KAB7623215.1 acylphosphatase [Alkalilimnicola sp. S0819]MPQ17063.1 acylphosphatase [Alkalilimnicola sp. S0819]